VIEGGTVAAEEFDQMADVPRSRFRAHEAVAAVLSDDHNFERGVQAVQAVADTVLAESGPSGVTEMAVELALKLAAAVERAAAEDGVPAADLADIWFVD
jgi:hypothetical protein